MPGTTILSHDVRRLYVHHELHIVPGDLESSEPSDRVRALVHALFHAHYIELSRFAYRYVKSRAIAEELVQECFYRVWKLADAAGDDGEPVSRAYLFRAVRNQALNYLKHRRVETAWEDADRSNEDPFVARPDQILDAADLQRAIHDAVERLPERCRAVFVLRRDGQLSYNEIAESLGVSPKTVENHMGRALRLLRQALGSYLAVGAMVTAMADAIGHLRS